MLSYQISCWTKIAFVVFLCGLALYCAGYATNYWEQSETSEKSISVAIGLWRYQNCSGGVSCTDYTYNHAPSAYRSTSYVATQALTSIVLVILVVILVLFLVYLIAHRCRESIVAVGILCLSLLAVLLALATMIIWVVQIPDLFYPGYSFGMFVLGFTLVLLAGLLMIPDIRESRRNREIRQGRTNRISDRQAEKDPRYAGEDTRYAAKDPRYAGKDARYTEKDRNADYYDDGQRRNYERYNQVRRERYDRDYDTVKKEKPLDYDEVRRERYERDIGRNENVKDSRIRDDADKYYQYNPNRKPFVRSPPPRYSTLADNKRDLGTPVPRPHRY